MRFLLSVGVVLAMSLTAQEAAAPTIDPQVVQWMHRTLQAADREVAARLEPLQKLPEYQRYEAAVRARTTTQAEVGKALAAQAPGMALDMSTGRLVPKPEATK